MALHHDLPKSPYQLLPPEQRWFPADESLRERSYEKRLPPLVAHMRSEGGMPRNTLAVRFRIDQVRANGELSSCTPDFIVRDAAGGLWIVETKGREELDLPQKMARLMRYGAALLPPRLNPRRRQTASWNCAPPSTPTRNRAAAPWR